MACYGDCVLTDKKATLALVLTACFWSLGGLLIKTVSLHPMAITGFRSLIAALVIAVVLRPPFLKRSVSQWGATLSYTATVITFVLATKWSSAASAILLQSTSPIYVALFGIFYLKERVDLLDLAVIATVFVGMLFFFGGELSSENLLGNFVGLLSGFCFGWFLLFMRSEKHGSPMSPILWGNIFACIVSIPFLALKQPSATDVGALLVLGVVQLAIPYFLYSKAVSYVKAVDTVLIFLLEPVLNPIWVYLFLGEKPVRGALIGGSLILGSVTLRSYLRSRRRAAAA